MAQSSAGQDDFVRAVMLTCDPTVPVGALKQAAQQYCASIQASPDGWRLCLQQLHNVSVSGGSDHVKFWCLQVLHGVSGARYDSMSEEDRSVLRRSLMLYVRDVIPAVSQSSFIKTKLCTVFVNIVKHDYPTLWPTFFTDFLSLLDKGPEVIDVFVRLLCVLDEEVVDDEAQRDPDHDSNTAIKDSMRERDLSSIVDAMYSICTLYQHTHPALVASALTAFCEYIAWIEITLVANQKWLSLLYGYMNPTNDPANVAAAAAAAANGAAALGASLPASPARPPASAAEFASARVTLQIAACDCLIDIIEKRMSAEKKVQLIKQVQVLEFLSGVILPSQGNALLPHQSAVPAIVQKAAEQYSERPEADALPDKLTRVFASLIQSIGSELIECCEKLLQPDKRPAPGALPSESVMALLVDLTPMLETCLMLGYPFFCHPLFLVSEEVFALYLDYVHMLNRFNPNTGEQRAWPWTATSAEHMRRIFAGLVKALSFPVWYNHAQPDDEDRDFFVFRSRKLIVLFNNLALGNPPLLLELMAARVTETLQLSHSLPWTTVEVTLKLFYQLGEVLKANTRTAEEPFRSMIGALLSSPLSAHPHPVISLLYFDVVFRFIKFLDHNPEFLGPVLTSFLDQRGIRHSNAQVRGRACYVFAKCLEVLPLPVKAQIRPFVDPMLKEIQGVIEAVLGPNAPLSSAKSLKAQGRGFESGGAATAGAAGAASLALLSADDVPHLCQSMGILVSSPVTSPERCHDYVALAFQFFRTQLESALTPQSQATWYPHDQERVGIRLAQLIDGVAIMTKPLSNDGARISDLMLGMAQVILQVLTRLPTHLPAPEKTPSVVLKSIVWAHRMIEGHVKLMSSAGVNPASVAAAAANGVVSPAAAADASILQFLSILLDLLLKHASAQSLPNLLDLLNYALRAFGKRLEALLDSIFLQVCEKVFAVLQSYAHVDQPQQLVAAGGIASPLRAGPNGSPPPALPAAAYSVERTERVAVQGKYFDFLKSIVKFDLVSVLTSARNAPYIKTVLDTILAGCVTPPDHVIHKSCFQLLRSLVEIWSVRGAIAADPQGLKLFVVRDVTASMFRFVCASHFNLTKPDCVGAVRDMLLLQSTLCTALGDEYLGFLASEFLASLRLSPQEAQTYCHTVVAFNAAAKALQGKDQEKADQQWKMFEGILAEIKQRNNPAANGAAPQKR